MSEATIIKLEHALQRLLQGVPLYTKADGKINLSRINSEARLSSGAIYYGKYKSFVEKAEKQIQEYEEKRKTIEDRERKAEEMSEVELLKSKLEHVVALKTKYRNERNEQKVINDGLLEQNCALALRVFELSCEVKAITQGRVTPLGKRSVKI